MCFFIVLNKTRSEYIYLYNKWEGDKKHMTLEERRNVSQTVVQNLILENREKLSISGVLDVLSFDDQIVMVETELRITHCKGRKLKN